MHDAATQKANFSQHIAEAIDEAVKNGDQIPKKYIEQAKHLHKNAGFIKRGLKKIFPNL